MIKKTLDFKDIDSQGDLGIYISTELKFSRITEIRSWDAYIDLFGELLYKEDQDGYKEEDGWMSYQEYVDFITNDKAIGLKNENGIRDDLELTFVNFYPFFWKHRLLAMKFLECTIFAKERSKTGRFYDPKEWLNLEIHINS